MKKLIYVAASTINFVDQDIQEKLKFAHTLDRKFWAGSHFFGSARYGQDHGPLNISTDKKIPCPEIDANFSKTFEEISDNKSLELLELCKKSNRKLGVYFSGGIDSTVILSAVIKNWPVTEYQNIEIFLNHASIIENYYFFKEQILANNLPYTLLHDTLSNNIDLANYVVTDGEPADKLWLVNIGLVYFKNHGNDSLKYNWKDKTDSLIKFISNYAGEEYANRYWNEVTTAMEEFPYVQTVGDWFSWINFNYHLSGHVVWQKWVARSNKDAEAWNNFQNFYQPWYLSEEFQKWSWGVSGREKSKFSSIIEYKKEAKQYIFDVTKEKFYYQFKTKMGSGVRFSPAMPVKYNPDILVFEDGTGMSKEHPDLNDTVRLYLK